MNNKDESHKIEIPKLSLESLNKSNNSIKIKTNLTNTTTTTTTTINNSNNNSIDIKNEIDDGSLDFIQPNFIPITKSIEFSAPNALEFLETGCPYDSGDGICELHKFAYENPHPNQFVYYGEISSNSNSNNINLLKSTDIKLKLYTTNQNILPPPPKPPPSQNSNLNISNSDINQTENQDIEAQESDEIVKKRKIKSIIISFIPFITIIIIIVLIFVFNRHLF